MANIDVGSGVNPLSTRSLCSEQFACWLMGGILSCGGIYGYMRRGSIPSVVAGVGLGAIYGYSGYLIRSGRATDGIDLSAMASATLLLAMGPRAYRTRAPVPVAISAAGVILLARMGYLSYCMHTKP
jgi:uncharacterized membrane protein (UPF0136 family)